MRNDRQTRRGTGRFRIVYAVFLVLYSLFVILDAFVIPRNIVRILRGESSVTEGDKTTYTITYTDGSTKTITIDAYDILSQSWAIGGTGTRTGEDTNNSKYYSEQSADSAVAASASENNATAAKVASESARDLAEQYKNAAIQSETNANKWSVNARSWAVGDTNTRGEEEATTNAKYFSE